LATLTVVGLFCVLICCGGGGVLVKLAFDVMAAEVENQLRDNERLREHIGEIEEIKTDWAKSFAEDDEDVFVYRVKGSQGSGELTVELATDEMGEQEVTWARLRLPSGTEVDLIPAE
jgi:hypothetical protein